MYYFTFDTKGIVMKINANLFTGILLLLLTCHAYCNSVPQLSEPVVITDDSNESILAASDRYLTDYTVTFWFSGDFTQIANNSTIAVIGYHTDICFNNKDGLHIKFLCNKDSKISEIITKIPDVNLSGWNSIAITYSQNNVVKIHINGKEIIPNLLGSTLVRFSNGINLFDVGKNKIKHYFPGTIIKPAIYAKALPLSEIMSLFNSQKERIAKLVSSKSVDSANHSLRLVTNISYINKNQDSYAKEMCKLDLYYPSYLKQYPVIVWFHGGGLNIGRRWFSPLELLDKGYAIVTVDYRLSPKVKAWEAIDDAADAVAWVFKNIENYGGDQHKIYIAGHSAGAYLASMVGLNPKYLSERKFNNLDLAGIIPVSGQMSTHFTVKRDRGDNDLAFVPVLDKYAPLGYVTQRIPNMFMLVGDRKIEWKARAEENALMQASLEAIGCSNSHYLELAGKDHITVLPAAIPLIKSIAKDHRNDMKDQINLDSLLYPIMMKKNDKNEFVFKTSDPQFLIKLPKPLNSNQYTTLEFEMKAIQGLGKDDWKLGEKGGVFWATVNEPDLSGKRHNVFTLVSDGAWYKYSIPLYKNSSYIGKITQIRIDPVDHAFPGKKVEIRNIRLTNGKNILSINK